MVAHGSEEGDDTGGDPSTGRTTAAESRPVLVVLAAGMAKRFGGGCKPLAPLGLHGEAVIDLTTGDALASGFGRVVLVLGPQTGPAIEYHVRRSWPASVPVAFAVQRVPLGTTHAVLCARRHVGDEAFAVVNADDVYGRPAMSALARLLEHGSEHGLVGYHLKNTVVGEDPVTRGTCEVGPDDLLVGITERKQVARQADGRFRSDDGKEPTELAPDTLVSMNLWGLRPTLWPVFEAAVRAVHPEVGADGAVTGVPASSQEVLLPEVVGAVVAGTAPVGGRQAFRVLPTTGRCVGVTHPDDLPLARAELADMVAQGLRSESPWDGVA